MTLNKFKNLSMRTPAPRILSVLKHTEESNLAPTEESDLAPREESNLAPKE